MFSGVYEYEVSCIAMIIRSEYITSKVVKNTWISFTFSKNQIGTL